jgi:hypothetical protein
MIANQRKNVINIDSDYDDASLDSNDFDSQLSEILDQYEEYERMQEM